MVNNQTKKEFNLPCSLSRGIGGSVWSEYPFRDVLLNDVPLLFRKDIYAIACVAGGGVYFSCKFFGLPTGVTEILAVLTVIVIRLVAVKFHTHLPQLQPIKSKTLKK